MTIERLTPALDILCFSTTDWDEIWGSRQQIMLRLAAAGQRVLFVERPVSVEQLLRSSDLRRRRLSSAPGPALRQERPNLWLFRPPLLPPGRYYSDTLNRWGNRLLVNSVRPVLQELGFERPILWLYPPQSAPLIGQFDEQLIVYHCIERFAARQSGRKRQVMLAQEEALLRRADLVFTHAAGLKALYDPLTKRPVVLVPSAADIAHFQSTAAVHPDVAALPAPRLGVMGTLDDRLDAGLLLDLAPRYPQGSLVLIGARRRAGPDLKALLDLPNVHPLGKRPFAELPALLNGMDALLIPYRRDELTEYISPIKLYEYLAVGKPVVSVDLPEVRPLAEWIEIAGREAFPAAVARALESDSPERQAARRQIARAHSWDARVQAMWGAILRSKNFSPLRSKNFSPPRSKDFTPPRSKDFSPYPPEIATEVATTKHTTKDTPQADPSPPPPLRIDWLITELSIVGGAERFVRTLAPLMRARGCDLRVITLQSGGRLIDELRLDGVPVIELGLQGKADFAALRRLLALWRADRPQIVHTHLYHAGLIGRLAAHRLGISPVVVHQHGPEQARSQLRSLLDRLLSPWAERYVVSCRAVADTLASRECIPAGRITIIPNGVDPQAIPLTGSAFKPKGWPAPPGAFVAGCVGRLSLEKGQAVLLRALAALGAIEPPVHAVFLGEGAELPELQALAQSLGVAERAHWMGLRRDVPSWLASFDLFALPSDWEGVSLALLESMAAGLPAVATRTGGTPEVVVDGETGLLVAPRDPQALAGAIRRLHADSELRLRMGQAARLRLLERFTLDGVARQLEMLYRDILDNPHHQEAKTPRNESISMAPSCLGDDSRLLVLHPITRLIVGGAQENTMLTAALLDPRRYRAAVISGPQTGSEGSLIEEVRARGVSLTVLPELVREVSPKNDLLALWKLYRLFRAQQPAIVHTHSSKAGIIGRMAAWLARVPVIVHTVHGWSFHEHMSPRVRMAYILMERLSARLCAALIVVAQPDVEKGLNVGIGRPEQYRLIRSAIPLDEFDPARHGRIEARRALGLPLDAPVLGNVGRFSAQKNPLDWVRAAAIVAQALPEARFLLVGDGPLRAEVEVAIAAAGLAERFILPGLRRDAGRMFAAMDVFMLTSLWEGLPRVIPQALAMGVPVVAYRADGTAEAIRPGETGCLCDPGDVQGMAASALALLSDESLRRRMAENGQAAVRQEFDLNAMIRQIEALYEELLEKKEKNRG